MKLFAIFIGINQKVLSTIQHKRMLKRLRSIAKEVAKAELKIFGIKIWYGEAFTYSKMLTAFINKYSPKTIVIGGGYHATLYEEDILKYSNLDLAVAGNGEDTLKQLLEFVQSDYTHDISKKEFLSLLKKNQELNPLPGLISRNGNEIEFNSREVNRPIQTIIPKYEEESGKTKVHILLESIGCPWNACNFCVHNKFVPVYHARKPIEIVEEIKAMAKQGIGLFRFAGSDTPPYYGQQIAEAILEANLSVAFTMGCRAVVNCKDAGIYAKTRHSFEILIKAGLRGVFMGSETANDTINHEVMNKGIVADDLLYTIKAFREAEKLAGHRATVSLAFIYPTPLVSGIDHAIVFQENIALIEKAQPDAVMATPPGPFKNTSWFYQAEKFGFDLAPNIIPRMMEYEYVLYKPVDLWDEIPFTLKDMHFKKMLAETQRFRKHIETELKIPTDLSDEHFLMLSSAGMMSEDGIWEFKHKALLSILSSDYSYFDELTNKVNAFSKALAEKSLISKN
jgi:hypothetical protein